MASSCKVHVDYEYTAEQEDELTLKVGDIISNVKKEDGGWWEGELNGKVGMFPDNFVTEIKEPVEVKKTEKKEQRHSQHGAHITALQDKLGKGLPMAGPQAQVKHRDDSSSRHHKRAKVAFSYSADNDDEISLEPGTTVEIIKEEEEGWYLGIAKGKQGLFPSNFVEVIEDETPTEIKEPPREHRPPPPTPDKEPQPEPEPEPAKPKKIQGVGLGNIFKEGPIKLRSTAGSAGNKKGEHKVIGADLEQKEDIPKKAESQPRPPSQPPPTLPPRTAKAGSLVLEKTSLERKAVVQSSAERARVVYSYVAENEDELNLEVGETVVILDKDLEDNGWWKGEVNGKVGVFPDNFVELLPLEEIKPKKPPPPAVPASTKPDLPPVTKAEHHHHRHHEKTPAEPPKKDNKPPPVLPGKKPVLPPPVSKKPAKPLPEAKSSASTHKAKESVEREKPAVATLGESKDELDSVGATKPLTHLTTTRPKGPTNKRPPSAMLKKESSPPMFNDTHTEEVVQKHNLKEEPILEVPSKEHKPPARPASTYMKTANHVSDSTTTGGGESSEAIADLRQQIRKLKEHNVSREQHETLKRELAKLRDEFSHYKTSTDKKVKMLMSDIDEEKKARLTMQVELDRLKKLVD